MSQDLPALFNLLADLSPEERTRFFNTHPIDEQTRRDLEELLAHDCASLDPFEKIVGSAAKAVLDGNSLGIRCGAFRLVSVLGTGGMGVVYLGQRADGEVKQRAAIKLMQPGWSDIQRERFLREREILAGLTHPNIAHLLDAGHLNDGQPYLAMEYVEGKRIDEYCKNLGTRKKVELFLKVCAAVDYLHANYVLHRDLKPSNILVTTLGEPKLLDFGIAKILDLQGPVTITQVRMATPDYSSPEQLLGGTLGPVSDIYSLGAVLYCLLTGKPPGGSVPPQCPSDLNSDLALVIQTAMRPEPQDRYATVAALSEDLRAYLDSRPVRARRHDWVYRIRKLAHRHPVTVVVGGALALALVGVSGLWFQQRHVTPAILDLRPERLTSNTAELPVQAAAISPDGKVIAYSDALGIHFHYASTDETRLLPGTDGHVIKDWLPDGSGVRTQKVEEGGNTVAALVSPTGTLQIVAPDSLQHTASPDGKHRALVDADRRRIVVEDATGGIGREIWAASDRTVTSFAWSPESKHIVVSSDSATSMLEIVDAVNGRRQTLIDASRNLALGGLAWPKPNRIIVAVDEKGRGVNSQGTSNLWEIRPSEGDAGLRRLTSWTDFPIRTSSFTTDGATLAFIRSFRQRDVYIADLDKDRTRMGPPRRLTLDLGDDYPTAWTPDSKAVLFTSDRNGPSAIFRQELDRQAAEQIVFGPTSQIIARAAPDAKWILFYGREGEKRGIMRAPMTGGKAELLFEVTGIMGLRCSRSGRCIVSERTNDVIVISEVDPVRGMRVREIYRDSVVRFAGPDLSPDGKWLATPFVSKIILRSFETGQVVREIPVRGATSGMELVNLDYAADGRGFFAGQTTPTETRQLYVDLSGKTSVLWRQAGKSSVWGVPSPDGKHLAMMVYTDDSNVYTIRDF